MASRTSKKIAVGVVAILLVTLIVHGINREFSFTGIIQNGMFKSRDPDGARIWRDSAQDKGSLQLDPNPLHINTTSQGGESLGAFSAQWGAFKHIGNALRTGIASGMRTDASGGNTMRIDHVDEASNHSGERTCKRHHNIAFFKMHKCSSSTVQNILMRYGNRYDLNFVLPPSGNYLGQTYFNKRFAQTFPVKEYNILTHHTRFSKEGFASIMPADALYATIIRDPATMFESTFTYLNYPGRYGIRTANALETFLADPNRYYLPNKGKDHAKDSMLFDLGLENDLKENEGAVQKKIKQIASYFDLVMMTEYFPESLILLKELMCWDFEDITFFKMNARSKSSVKTVSDAVVAKIRKWNAGDVMLYEHFNRTFWDKVRAFGEDRMRAEVKKLEQLNEVLRARCIADVVVNDRKVWHPSGINVESFKVKDSAKNNTDCLLMAKTELPFTAYIRQKQLAKYFGQKEPSLL